MKAWWVGIVLATVAQAVHAYPTTIAKGYTNCASCHYNPTGGGLPNSYGHATLAATFPDDVTSKSIEHMRTIMQKNDVTGYGEDKRPAFQWDVGADIRLLLLSAYGEAGEDGDGGEGEDGGDEGGEGEKFTFIPMLLEVGGVMGYGPLLTYVTVTARRSGAGRAPDSAFSREHWIGYRFSEAALLRIGRMVLPFGIRAPDHTLYTREDFGFDKWGQSYGLEWDLSTEHWMIAAAGFAGDFQLEPIERQERGAVASVTYNVPSNLAIGSSFLTAFNELTSRLAGSLFARWRLFEKIYGLAELSSQYRWSDSNSDDENEIASFVRVGFFPIESLDLFIEWGIREILQHGDLAKSRYLAGAQWQVLPWLEISPGVMFEDFDTGTEFTPLGQFHIIY